MSSTNENTVLDFDLDFLPETVPNAESELQARADRLRKSIIFLKTRVKTVDQYVSGFYSAHQAVQEKEVIETQLKDRCKQHHVEIGSFIEKVTRLENELQSAEAREREKDEKVSELENQIVALQTLQTQLKLLEIEKNKPEPTPVKVERKNGKAGVANNAKKGLLEVETLRKENAKFLNVDKENEKLRKENARIPSLEKEIETLRKNITIKSKSEKINENIEIARIQKLEKEIEGLCKENARISKLEREIETLNKKNAELSKLEKEIENLQKENAKIPKLTKEIESLCKENAKITKLTKEIESLRKENAKITKLGNDDDKLFKQSVIISNLEKDIEAFRIKNARFEMENKVLRKEIVKIQYKEEEIETRLTHLSPTTNEKGKLPHKLPRKYKSLPDRNDEWCDLSEAKNGGFEDRLLSPIPDDTVIARKSPISDKDVEVPRDSNNDYCNEVASVDTGRGSSVANSDTDKSLHSPEYVLNNNPPNGNNIENQDDPVSKCSIQLDEIETSPIITIEHDQNQNVCEPISGSQRKSHSKLSGDPYQTIAAREVTKSAADNFRSKKRIQGEQEKECLEMNNSLRCHSHNDVELGHIFSTTKLNFRLVSPIPRTPVWLPQVDSTFSPIELQKKRDLCNRLTKETGVFLMQLSLRLDDPNSVTMSDYDRLIACFDSILKLRQILTECSISNTNSNIEISDCVLSQNYHNLESISYAESTTSSSEKETERLQNKKGENRLSQDESWPILDKIQNRMLCDDNNSITITSPSPPHMDTNIIKHKQVEKCLNISMDESQTLNNSVSEESAMSNEISEVIECDVKSTITNSVVKKPKNKKNTKLGKLKKKLKPKYKIRMEQTPPRNLWIESKQLTHDKKKVTVNDTSASLNQKEAYEKAVKVMAELNSQQGAKAKSSSKYSKVLRSPRRTASLEKGIVNSGDNQEVQNDPIKPRSKRKFSELFDTCSVVLVKDPLLHSPQKAKKSTNHATEEDNNSTTHRAREFKSLKTQRAKKDDHLTIHKTNEDNDPTTHTGKEDTNFTTHTAKESNDSTTDQLKENSSTNHRAKEKNDSMTHQAKDNSSTNQRTKEDNDFTTHQAKDNSYTSHRAKEDNDSTTHQAKDNSSTSHRVKEDNDSTTHQAKDNSSTTYRAKEDNDSTTHQAKDNSCTNQRAKEDNDFTTHQAKDNSSTTHRAKEDNDSMTHQAKDNGSTTNTAKEDNDSTTHQAKDNSSTTHKAKEYNDSTTHLAKDNSSTTQRAKKDKNSITPEAIEDSSVIKEEQTEDAETCNQIPSRKRRSSNEPIIQFKRVLRSTTINSRLSTEENIELSKSKGASNRKSITGLITNDKDSQLKNKSDRQRLRLDQHNDSLVSYGDLEVFSEDVPLEKKTSAPVTEVNTEETTCHPKESILCYMLEKHGVETVRLLQKKIPENTVKQVCEKIEQGITTIAEAKDNKTAMNNFVDDLRKLNYKHFIAGLIKFLAKPERKDELFGKIYSHPAPPMTKAEQILLYAINQLETTWPSVDIVDAVLSSIEFTLFKLNRTPEFNVIETTSHFYAILCRYVKAKSRLRLFMLDAMYCIQFKAVPLIKQCLEVWMHIIPLSHMGMAKSPLVTCLVYLLHFYKCEDKFNRVTEIRKILREKYYYQITDWNESKILEMFKNSIKDLKEISIEKKMLRLALIILAKRQGPQWCQNNIIKNLLQPMIEKEKRNNVQEFCISMIGPLMRPYPIDMKVHCEIAINQLVDILNKNPSPEMEEAAITSMIYINRHDQRSVNKTLLSSKMKPMSSALEKTLREYVKAKPLKIWMTNLTTIRR